MILFEESAVKAQVNNIAEVLNSVIATRGSPALVLFVYFCVSLLTPVPLRCPHPWAALDQGLVGTLWCGSRPLSTDAIVWQCRV